MLIVNKDLQNKFEQGVIFTLDTPGCLDFFPLARIKRELPQLSPVEAFKIENRLKPTGALLVVTPTAVVVHNFDESLDKKTNSCQVYSSLHFTDN